MGTQEQTGTGEPSLETAGNHISLKDQEKGNAKNILGYKRNLRKSYSWNKDSVKRKILKIIINYYSKSKSLCGWDG